MNLFFPFKLNSSFVENKSSDFLNTLELFSYDESLSSDSMSEQSNLEDLRPITHLDGANGDHELDETSPSVNNQTGEANVPPNDGSIPCPSIETKESSQNSTNPSGNYSLGVTRSRRDFRMPVWFSDYLVEGKHKIGIEKLLIIVIWIMIINVLFQI